jgi:sterol desaturase/sphingolipid hydroxylase (fatty acid hydroxylase superfamily)
MSSTLPTPANVSNPIASAWLHICNTYEPRAIEVWGSMILQILTFWLPATLYVLLDFLFPAFSSRHKLQSSRKQPGLSEIFQAARVSFFNSLYSTAVHYLFVYHLRKPSGLVVSPTLPSLGTIALQFLFGLVFREITFYYFHRLFHHPFIYPKVHKLHHQFTAPIAYSAQYATILEHAVANTAPIVLPHMLLGGHIVSFWLFVGAKLWEAAADHSGYDFIKIPAAKIHDEHHEKFRVYYSTLGVMDWIHGTDRLPNKLRE